MARFSPLGRVRCISQASQKPSLSYKARLFFIKYLLRGIDFSKGRCYYTLKEVICIRAHFKAQSDIQRPAQ